MPAISGAPHDLRVLRDVRGFFLVYIGFRWQRRGQQSTPTEFTCTSSRIRNGAGALTRRSARLCWGWGPGVPDPLYGTRQWPCGGRDHERRVSGQL
jgi:hypothetical protein